MLLVVLETPSRKKPFLAKLTFWPWNKHKEFCYSWNTFHGQICLKLHLSSAKWRCTLISWDILIFIALSGRLKIIFSRTYLYAIIQIRNSVLILPQKVAKHLVVTSGNTRLRSLRNTRLDYKSPFWIGNSRRLMVGWDHNNQLWTDRKLGMPI